MTDADAAVPKAKSSSRRKQTTSSTSLPHEIDSAGRTRAATRILVKLPKSNASAPADLTPGAEIPELGDTRATTTEGVPLPVPFPIDASDAGSGLPTLQTVSSSSLNFSAALISLPMPPDKPQPSKPVSAKEEYTTS
ncbi:hypothetical protein DFH08DRAFT_827132 [Mycena albidolilacea]|uniref:Uncharacterized protein n=1 Tax=Mycena albidolilacea TaxID=1033008 RepID=A0AAD6YZH8_9AGAR|nr:hypothetical protein DFH08DRAFT_827132 [Mycena albidolilacea]